MNEILDKVRRGIGRSVHMPFVYFDEAAPREVIAARLDQLKADGIESIMAAVRTSQYMGSGYWKDMDVLVEELQRRDMSFWVQDEKDFPTGSANGWIRRRRPDLAKLFIDRRHIDAVGPLKGASFPIASWLDPNNPNELEMEIIEGRHDGGTLLEDRTKNTREYPKPNLLLAVLACRKNGDDGSMCDEVLDLTDCVSEGYLLWDVPEGFWRVIILFTTHKSTGRTYYINMLDRESVRLEIEAVYEPMYERYGEHFGKTFSGFFTDEPEFGNACGYGVDYDNGIGKRFFPLPWCKELEDDLLREYGTQYLKWLPALWYDMGRQKTAVARVKYMDMITKIYRKNFVEQIGEWCRERGCAYTGHMLEDGGNTTRLGAGAGHFFRAEKGQTISGVDLVYDQIIPGFDSVSYYWTTGNHDGEEFTYSLAKMGSSAAHIDPLKKGFALCETYLSYEQVHGLKHLKYNCDNLVSRGVNVMMPHFLAGGVDWYSNPMPTNPQYRYYGIVTNYLSRICRIQSDGRHIAPAAVLYHAEAEWAGDYMNCARPIKIMTQDQIDCDIIPQDVFTMKDVYRTEYKAGALKVNDEEYRALVIPYSEFITRELALAISELDIPIAFIDKAPSEVLGEIAGLALEKASAEILGMEALLGRADASGEDMCLGQASSGAAMDDAQDVQGAQGGSAGAAEEALALGGGLRLEEAEAPGADVRPGAALLEKACSKCEVVPLADIAKWLRSKGVFDVELTQKAPGLRYYRYAREGFTSYFFFNEFPYTGIDTTAMLPETEKAVFYDPLSNRFFDAETEISGDKSLLPLRLHPYETIMAIFGDVADIETDKLPVFESEQTITGEWKLEYANSDDYPEFTDAGVLPGLVNMGTPERFQSLFGTLRYSISIQDKPEAENIMLDLGDAFETAEVFVNEKPAGVRVCPPYHFNVGDLLNGTVNEIVIDITGTNRDLSSQTSMYEPFGLLGPVKLRF